MASDPQVPACDETSGQNRRWKAGGEITSRCQKVKYRIRGSTRRQHASDCILETLSRHKRSRGHALVDEPDGSSATLACGFYLQRIEGRNIVRTHGRDAEHLVAIVLAVN
jgi:hypothetical protein